jgi:glycosidase
MIYYGDEVGMWGADDPHDRKPMIWDDLVYENEIITEQSGFKTGFASYSVEQNKDLLQFYKEIIEIRSNNEVLKTGTIKFIYSDNEKIAFAFESVIGDEKIISAFNLGEAEVSIPLNFEVAELYSSNHEINSDTKLVAAKSFKVYTIKK